MFVLLLSMGTVGYLQHTHKRRQRVYPRSGEIACLSETAAPVVQPDTLSRMVQQAAWTAEVHGQQRRAVMITSCDSQCLEDTFEPFIRSIQQSKDGDFSQHLVIVCIRQAALSVCQKLQQQGHKHHCLLDPGCSPPFSSGPGGMEFLGPDYNLALLQKTRLAAAILQLNISVAWTDMDMTYFQNPLRFLFEAAPDADLVIQSEEWDRDSSFSGDVCRWAGVCCSTLLCSWGWASKSGGATR